MTTSSHINDEGGMHSGSVYSDNLGCLDCAVELSAQEAHLLQMHDGRPDLRDCRKCREEDAMQARTHAFLVGNHVRAQRAHMAAQTALEAAQRLVDAKQTQVVEAWHALRDYETQSKGVK